MDEDKPQKVECEVAKYLRSHLPQKQTTLHSHKVDYFIGMCYIFFIILNVLLKHLFLFSRFPGCGSPADLGLGTSGQENGPGIISESRGCGRLPGHHAASSVFPPSQGDYCNQRGENKGRWRYGRRG